MKWLAPAAVVVIAVVVELLLGRGGHGPDAALFIGRFHPLIVHLPIGFFLLVAMGEAATFHRGLRERVEPALGLLLPVSAAAALTAFVMGQLLALEGGFPAGALSWHRRLTLIAVLGMCACWVAFERQRARGHGARWLYRGLLGATLAVLSLGAHFGGTMTRGEGYLAKYAPGPLKPLLGAQQEKPRAQEPAKAASAIAEPLIFQDVIQPILTKHCAECHGSEKQKGKLRLDSLEQLLKGGENGSSVVAGVAAKSPLLQRMLLPVGDDDRMPPEGKPSPTPEELALIEFWIERGATPTLKVRDVLAPTLSRALLERSLKGAKTELVPGAAAPPADSAGEQPAVRAPDSDGQASAAQASSAAPVPALAPATSSEAAPTPPDAAPEASATPAPPAAVATSGAAFLATHCQKCHGPQKQKGKLRVDSRAGLLKGGADGPALVPGSPDKSSIVRRVRLPLSNDEHMPPRKEPQPSAAEIAAFVAWVRASTAITTAADATAATSPDSSQPEPESPSSPPAVSVAGRADGTASPAPATSGATPPAAAAELSGPADPALLKQLPTHVILFSDAIQPLLRDKCGKCHIREKPAGGLGVEQHARLLEGGFSGAAIVPKHRAKSLLFSRVVLPLSHDEHMPPEAEPQLSADESELLGAWIDQGAPVGGVTEMAQLTGGAVRALAARGIKPAPAPLAAQAGGCAACSVPGAPPSHGLTAQAVSLLAAAMLLAARRRPRALVRQRSG